MTEISSDYLIEVLFMLCYHKIKLIRKEKRQKAPMKVSSVFSIAYVNPLGFSYVTTIL